MATVVSAGFPPAFPFEFPFEFHRGKLLGIDDHATLGAAEGKIEHGPFACHPKGEGFDFFEVGLRMKTQAAFAGAAQVAVADAIALEGAQAAVVHAHRHGDGEHGFSFHRF